MEFFLSSTRICAYGKQTAPLMGQLARWRGQQDELAAFLNGAGTAPKASLVWCVQILSRHPQVEGSSVHNLDLATGRQNERVRSDLAKRYGLSPYVCVLLVCPELFLQGAVVPPTVMNPCLAYWNIVCPKNASLCDGTSVCASCWHFCRVGSSHKTHSDAQQKPATGQNSFKILESNS